MWPRLYPNSWSVTKYSVRTKRCDAIIWVTVVIHEIVFSQTIILLLEMRSSFLKRVGRSARLSLTFHWLFFIAFNSLVVSASGFVRTNRWFSFFLVSEGILEHPLLVFKTFTLSCLGAADYLESRKLPGLQLEE